jgi:hypothetical protein
MQGFLHLFLKGQSKKNKIYQKTDIQAIVPQFQNEMDAYTALSDVGVL